MKKIIALLLSVAFGCSLACAGIPSSLLDSGGPFIPAGVDTAGGPDGFGYTWKDNLEPGGPHYRWLDVSSVGELVNGLGDDNYVGPFQIGFSFRYYWYDVTQFYIGSNGYLKFGSAASIASPFPASIPLTAAPNDFIGVYMADWVLGSPTAPDSCIYWTNNQDTCVISWVNVEAWLPTGNTGSHTFQVILAGTDSSITFQIGNQSGEVYNLSTNWELSGIECNNGQVGLQRSANMLMPANYPVQFYYPDVVTYQVHDLAAEAVANPNSEGFFIEVGTDYEPWAVVKNVGNQTETSYTAQFLVQQIGGGVQYNQTVSGGPIAPGEEQVVTYAATWTPSVTAQYATRLTVTLVGDMNTANNLKSAECRALTLPGTLLFDDGSAEAYLQWQGGGGGTSGAAVRFVPPSYPVRIDSVKFYEAQPTEDVILRIQDDDGTGGIPGTVLYSDTVDVTTTNTWYARGVTAQNIDITDGAFYVVWLMLTATSGLGEDQTATWLGSRQAWEYTGVWAPYRAAETSDFLVRALISPIAGPNQPPEIVDFYPANLDTVEQGDAVDFGVTATDPDGDPLSFLWKLDDVVQGTDSTVTIVFNDPGSHEVWVWASDGELADSMNWSLQVVGVMEEVISTMPTDYALGVAYPNPFNPMTTITFSLPKPGDVRLAVYDQTGREIAKLVAGWRPAGIHQVVFDATGFSSGIYIVKMMTGNFTASQKIVMMK